MTLEILKKMSSKELSQRKIESYNTMAKSSSGVARIPFVFVMNFMGYSLLIISHGALCEPGLFNSLFGPNAVELEKILWRLHTS